MSLWIGRKKRPLSLEDMWDHWVWDWCHVWVKQDNSWKQKKYIYRVSVSPNTQPLFSFTINARLMWSLKFLFSSSFCCMDQAHFLVWNKMEKKLTFHIFFQCVVISMLMKFIRVVKRVISNEWDESFVSFVECEILLSVLMLSYITNHLNHYNFFFSL